MRRFTVPLTLAIALLLPVTAPTLAHTAHHASRTHIGWRSSAVLPGLHIAQRETASVPSPLASRFGATTESMTAKCTTTGYSKNCGGCAKFGAKGKITITIPKTKLAATGTQSSKTKGSTVCLAKIAAPKPSPKGIGVRVTATGPFGTLHIKKVTIYLFNVKKNTLSKVKGIKKPGIYQVAQ